MAIIKTLKTIGNTKTHNLYERLIKRSTKTFKNENPQFEIGNIVYHIISYPDKTNDQVRENYLDLVKKKYKLKISKESLKKFIREKYIYYRKESKVLIDLTQKMLTQVSKRPELKDANFYFIERDAVPLMYIAKEIGPQFKFKPGQFQKLTSVSPNNPLFPEYLKKTINTDKPIILLDIGLYGSNIAEIENIISQNIRKRTYSVLFTFESDHPFYLINPDFVISNTSNSKEMLRAETLPKFIKKARDLTIKDNNTIKITRGANEKNGGRDIVSAEIFMIALRNQLARYKPEKEIK